MSNKFKFINDSTIPVTIDDVRIVNMPDYTRRTIDVTESISSTYQAYAKYYDLYDSFVEQVQLSTDDQITVDTLAISHYNGAEDVLLLQSNDLRAHVTRNNLFDSAGDPETDKYYEIRISGTHWVDKWLPIAGVNSPDDKPFMLYRFDSKLNAFWCPRIMWHRFTSTAAAVRNTPTGGTETSNSSTAAWTRSVIQFLTKYTKTSVRILMIEGRVEMGTNVSGGRVIGGPLNFEKYDAVNGEGVFKHTTNHPRFVPIVTQAGHSVDFVDGAWENTISMDTLNQYDVLLFGDPYIHSSSKIAEYADDDEDTWKYIVNQETLNNIITWGEQSDGTRGFWFISDHDLHENNLYGFGGVHSSNALVKQLHVAGLIAEPVEFRGDITPHGASTTDENLIREFGDVFESDKNNTISQNVYTVSYLDNWQQTSSGSIVWHGNDITTQYVSNGSVVQKEVINCFPRVNARYFRLRPISHGFERSIGDHNWDCAGKMELYQNTRPLDDRAWQTRWASINYSSSKPGLAGEHDEKSCFLYRFDPKVNMVFSPWILHTPSGASAGNPKYYRNEASDEWAKHAFDFLVKYRCDNRENIPAKMLILAGQITQQSWQMYNIGVGTDYLVPVLESHGVEVTTQGYNDGSNLVDISMNTLNQYDVILLIDSPSSPSQEYTSYMTSNTMNNIKTWMDQSDGHRGVWVMADHLQGTVGFVINDVLREMHARDMIDKPVQISSYLRPTTHSENICPYVDDPVFVENFGYILGKRKPGGINSIGQYIDTVGEWVGWGDQSDYNKPIAELYNHGNFNKHTPLTTDLHDENWSINGGGNDQHPPHFASYRYNGENDIVGWGNSAPTYVHDPHRYLQVDLRDVTAIDAVGTKGRNSTEYWFQWFEKYIIQYSVDGEIWYTIGLNDVSESTFIEHQPMFKIENFPERTKFNVVLQNDCSIRTHTGQPIIQADQPISIKVNNRDSIGRSLLARSSHDTYVVDSSDRLLINSRRDTIENGVVNINADPIAIRAPIVTHANVLGVYNWYNKSSYSIDVHLNGTPYNIQTPVEDGDRVNLDIDVSPLIQSYSSFFNDPEPAALQIDYECPTGSNNLVTIDHPVVINNVNHLATPVEKIYVSMSHYDNGNLLTQTKTMRLKTPGGFFAAQYHSTDESKYYEADGEYVQSGVMYHGWYRLVPQQLSGTNTHTWQLEFFGFRQRGVPSSGSFHKKLLYYTPHDNNSFITEYSYYTSHSYEYTDKQNVTEISNKSDMLWSPGAADNGSQAHTLKHDDWFEAVFTFNDKGSGAPASGEVDVIDSFKVLHRLDLDDSGALLQLEWENTSQYRAGLMYMITYRSSDGTAQKYMIPHVNQDQTSFTVTINTEDHFTDLNLVHLYDATKLQATYGKYMAGSPNYVMIQPMHMSGSGKYNFTQIKKDNTFPWLLFDRDPENDYMSVTLFSSTVLEVWEDKYSKIAPAGVQVTTEIALEDLSNNPDRIVLKDYSTTKSIGYGDDSQKSGYVTAEFSGIPDFQEGGVMRTQVKFGGSTRIFEFPPLPPWTAQVAAPTAPAPPPAS